MERILLFVVFTCSLFASTISKEINCKIFLHFYNIKNYKCSYINNSSGFFYIDTIGVQDDSILLNIEDPQIVTLYINNDAKNLFNLYLDKGEYTICIDVETKDVKIIGSPLNDEYKEMMRVHDSLYKLYNIMYYILYPYNGTNRDTALEWLQKYGTYCDSLSDIHISKFYETHTNSFLTLENIYNELEYTFEDPGFDSIRYNKQKLKNRFDKLNPALKKYTLYQKCIELFNREYPKLVMPLEPLFQIEKKD
ncbi:MAG TPA: DUF4369 domain-containing protein [Chitinophagales bacterium]|nr:DUF4369 domain-containing protein [Chitinophagales bacterium]